MLLVPLVPRYFSSAIFVNALPAKSAGYKDLLTTLLITIVFDLKSNGMKGLVEKMIWLLCFVC